MGRKYKQQGYHDADQERKPGQRQQPRRSSEGPRSPRMPGFQEVMRCSMCGNIIPAFTEIKGESQCSKCGGDLRSCKHCRHFDTGAQFECTQAILERVAAKDKRNYCEFFEARTSVERETSSPSSKSNPSGGANSNTPKAARSAFDDLFR
jgi:hypothetical protein